MIKTRYCQLQIKGIPKILSLLVGLLALFVCTESNLVAGENWARFRGPNGSGISAQKGYPGSWKPREEAWIQTIPGEGHSSPVIWQENIFLASASNKGKTRSLFCLEVQSGDIIWKKSLTFHSNHINTKNSWASSSPTTDGKHVYITFADKNNYIAIAYDMDGNEIWRKNLGPFASQHGQGVSPILFKNMLFVANDQKGFGSLIALDKNNGDVVWNSSREFRRVSYSTPIIYQADKKSPQLIVSCGAMGITSVDPANGSINWYSGELPARTVSSPFISDGLIYQTCGAAGRGKKMIGVSPDGKGLLDDSYFKFQRKKETPYVPTAISYEGHIYLWCDNGVVSCVENKTGKNIWTKRVGGNYSGSPICVNGIIYIMSEAGKIAAIDASPEYHLYHKTELGELSHSTPAEAGGKLFFRTSHKLICYQSKP